MTDVSPLIVILAGGAATRMGGMDKGLIDWKGERLIDRIYDRLSSQGDIVISGRHSYGKLCAYIEDISDSQLQGPAAGLEAVLRWMTEERLPHAGFFTVPIDGPNPPLDLISRLGGTMCAVAVDADGYVQPTFAYWRRDVLAEAMISLGGENAPALKYLSKLCGAKHVKWTATEAFLNINSANDLAQQSE